MLPNIQNDAYPSQTRNDTPAHPLSVNAREPRHRQLARNPGAQFDRGRLRSFFFFGGGELRIRLHNAGKGVAHNPD